MKTISTKPRLNVNPVTGGAFTLIELLVVVAVIAVLTTVRLSALAGAKGQSKVAQCAGNVRQLALATQIFANENRDQLPVINAGFAWAWDFPDATAQAMLASGVQQRTFYCPGTAPRFNDNLNFLNPAPNSLWNFFGSGGNFHVIGYVMAFTGSAANPTSFALTLSNQNTTILPERPRLTGTTYYPAVSASDRPLIADATISANLAGTAADPAPAGSFTDVPGGFSAAHISPHLKGTLPAGGNIAFKDGHVQWRKFSDMAQRASSGRGFWW